MALLMVKTHDLSWQDHTMNIEVMLAPSRNQLLLSKHKTLATKCDKDKRIFEKERDSILRNFVAEKRIMERRKQALLRRRSDILVHRVSSAETQPGNTRRKSLNVNLNETRGNSAPARIAWEKPGNTVNSNVFLTEATKPTITEDHTSQHAILKSADQIKNSTNILYIRSDVMSPSQVSTSSKRVISPPGSKKASNRDKSVRFDDKYRHTDTNLSERPLSYCLSSETSALNDRVKQFVKSQSDFNKKPPVTFRQKRMYGNGYKEPLVAKKNTGFSYDKTVLENAFDNFCINKNMNEFQKLVRMATKMKNNLQLARNQSIVPTLAAFKTSKVFKSLISDQRSSPVIS